MQGLTASQMVALPWTWQGPGREPQRDQHGNEWFEIRIKELPDFFIAAQTPEEAIAQAGPSLEAFLESFDETPPLPESVRIVGVEGYREGFKVVTDMQAA